MVAKQERRVLIFSRRCVGTHSIKFFFENILKFTHAFIVPAHDTR